MDGLRPDSDEVDNFQQSRTSRTNKKTTKRKANSNDKPVSVSSPKQAGEPKSRTANKSGSNTVLGFIVVVLLVGVMGAGWIYNEQRQELTVLKVELEEALGFIRQSKLLMARFEGKLSETGDEMAEGDTEAQKKLKFLDSEVRKLWGVAYDRNRKAIGLNDGLIKAHASELKNTDTALKNIALENKKQTDKLNELVKSLSVQQSSSHVLQSELLSIKGSNEHLFSQIKQLEDTSNAAVMVMRQEINQLAENNKIVARVQNNEVAIEAIDASRLQLNERFIVLDRKLNDLQLSTKPSQSATGK